MGPSTRSASLDNTNVEGALKALSEACTHTEAAFNMLTEQKDDGTIPPSNVFTILSDWTSEYFPGMSLAPCAQGILQGSSILMKKMKAVYLKPDNKTFTRCEPPPVPPPASVLSSDQFKLRCISDELVRGSRTTAPYDAWDLHLQPDGPHRPADPRWSA